MEIPAKLRPEGWPATIPLPDDEVQRAVRAAELNRQLDEARAASKEPAKATVGLMVVGYRKSAEYGRLSERTKREYARYLSRLLDEMGSENVAAIGPKAIRAYLSRFDDTPRQRDMMVAVLSNVLNQAINDEEIQRNPLHEMRVGSRAKPKQGRLWTDDEFNTMCQVARDQGRFSVLTAMTFCREGAQRVGDALRLQWDWIGDDGLIRFTQSKRKRQVALPMTKRLRNVISETREMNSHPTFVVVNETNGRPYDTNPDLPNTTFYHVFARLRAMVGLDDLDMMYLRHTGVMERVRAGLTIPQIAQHTGWSPRNVYDVIQHYMPTDESSAIAAGQILEDYRSGQITDV